MVMICFHVLPFTRTWTWTCNRKNFNFFSAQSAEKNDCYHKKIIEVLTILQHAKVTRSLWARKNALTLNIISKSVLKFKLVDKKLWSCVSNLPHSANGQAYQEEWSDESLTETEDCQLSRSLNHCYTVCGLTVKLPIVT